MTLGPRFKAGEARRVGLFAVFFFLIVVTTVIGKTARNTFFLTRNGPELLPWMYIGIAVFMAGVMPLYGRLWGGVSPRLRGVAVGIVFGSGTLLFALAEHPVAFLLFYPWVEVGTAILFFEYWMLAGRHFTPREGKQWFGIIGLGAGLAPFLGGFGLRWAVGAFGAGLLIPATGAASLAAAGVALAIPSRSGPSRADAPKTTSRAAARTERGNARPEEPGLRAYLWTLGVAAAASTVVFTIVDYQFKVVASQLQSEAEVSRLFLTLSVIGGFGALTTQLLGTSSVLKRFGVSGGMLPLPVAQLLGSLALLWRPALLAAGFLRATDRSFRFTIDQASRQVLWLPLDGATQQRGKPLFDESAKHIATGAAGLLMLGFGGGLRVMSATAVVFTLVWLVANRRLSRLYVDRIRVAISGHRQVSEPLEVSLSDPKVVDVLRQALRAPDEAEALFVLGLLGDADTSRLRDELQELWRRASPLVRERIVELAEKTPGLLTDEDLMETAGDASPPRLAAAALRTCGRRPGAAMAGVLRTALESQEALVRIAGAAALAHRTGADAADLALPIAVFRDGLQTGTPEVRAAVMWALSERTSPELLPEIIANLGHAGTSSAATRALEAHGVHAIGPIVAWLAASPDSPCLAGYRALVRVVDSAGSTPDTEDAVARLLEPQRTEAVELSNLLQDLRREGRSMLWQEHVAADLAVRVRVLCCLAACLAPRHGLEDQASRLLGTPGIMRSNVLEYFDNVLPNEVGRWLVPLLDDLSTGVAPETATEAKPPSASAAPRVQATLDRMAASPRGWDRLLAYHERPLNDVVQGDPAMRAKLENILFLRKVDLFAGLSGEQTAAVADLVNETQLGAGDTLFREGENGGSLYVIRSGAIELSRGGRVVGTPTRGECFGEFAVLDGQPRTATGTATEDTELLELPRQAFLEAMATHPAILEGVLGVLTARIRDLIARESGTEPVAGSYDQGAVSP